MMRPNLWLIIGLSVIVPTSHLEARTPSGLFSELPTPGGVLVGMTLAEAKSALASNGYQHKSNCDYEVPGPNRNVPAARISLTVKSRKSVASATGTYNAMDLAAATCSNDEYRVTTVQWFRGAGAERLDPAAEFAGLTVRFGTNFPNGSFPCGDLTYNRCLFRQLPGKPEIERMTVTIQPNMGRAEINADPRQIWAPDPARAGEFESVTREAATLCRQAGQSERGRIAGVHALIDCACVADRLAREYVIGIRDAIDPGAIYENSDYCANPDTAIISEYFANDCAESITVRTEAAAKAWNEAGGCECVADKATEAFLRDPRLVSKRQRPDSYRDCGFHDRQDQFPAAAANNLNGDMVTVIQVQQLLAIVAKIQLTATGVYDEPTRQAIIEFEKANQMPVTGNVTTELVNKLNEARR